MALVLEIILGVMILASFYVAYMSARTWPIYQAVLVSFLFLGTVAFFYLAARTLKTHDTFRKRVISTQKELERVEQNTRTLVDGGPADEKGQPNPKGIRQLKEDLHKLALDRGGVLYDVTVEGVKDGVVQLALKSPDHGLVPKMVLFAFDQTGFEEGGRYLGEFKVVGVGEDATKVQIAPNLPLNDAQTQRLAAVKGPLTLYTTMPIDNGALFAALDEPARQALLPKDSQTEYAKADRKLRDYEYLFHENFVQRSIISDNISELNGNISRITNDTKQTDEEVAFRQTEKGNLQADLEKFQAEIKAIAAYQTSLEQLLAQVRGSLRTTFASIRQKAAELTAAQLKAAEEINARTAAVAGGPVIAAPVVTAPVVTGPAVSASRP